MNAIRVSNDFGLVIRKQALKRQNISLETLFQMMEVSEPYDENDSLISFGPHFGEAVNYFIQKLEAIGLIFGEDFIDFKDPTLPRWCIIYLGELPDDILTETVSL